MPWLPSSAPATEDQSVPHRTDKRRRFRSWFSPGKCCKGAEPLMPWSARDHAGTETQPRMGIEVGGFATAHSKCHCSLQATTTKHPCGSHSLRQTAPIPRHSPRQNTHRPSDLFGYADLRSSGCGRSFSARRSQPGRNAPKRKKSHGNSCDREGDQCLPQKPSSERRDPAKTTELTPHAGGLLLPSWPETAVDPPNKSPARRHTPSQAGQRGLKK
jgi:hypothetical protein